MSEPTGELAAPSRLMMTAGPCSLDPRVYRAMSTPLVGHNDPWFAEMMVEVQALLRRAFQTQNRVTFPISASGSGGIEAAMINPLEPGDHALICVNGTFSERMATIASRVAGTTIHRVEAPLGRVVDAEDVRRTAKGKKLKFIGFCHGETSTGVLSPIEPFRKVADEAGTMLVVDAVATLCGTPLDVDRQRIDLCFSGSQKAINAAPGMAPITIGPRMEEALRARRTPVQSWYFDLTRTIDHWGKEKRIYQNTPAISLIVGLLEALHIVFEEGLEARWQRHRQNQLALVAGLEALGMELFVPNAKDRLPTVTSVHVPKGVDDARVRGQLLSDFGIEIAGGIGSLRGKIWRVGLMGYVSQAKHLLSFLGALERVLLDQGLRITRGAAVEAASRLCDHSEAVTVGPRR